MVKLEREQDMFGESLTLYEGLCIFTISGQCLQVSLQCSVLKLLKKWN
jgi:hypothetical protein